MNRYLALLGLVLVVLGALAMGHGLAHDRTVFTVIGIVVLIDGLICFRVVRWRVRVRAMTRAGLALHDPSDPSTGQN